MQVTEVNSGWGRLLSRTQGAAGTGCHCPQSPSFSLSPSHIDEVPVRRLIFSAWHLRPCTPGLLSQPLRSPALQQAAFPWGCRLPELPHTCTMSLTMAQATPANRIPAFPSPTASPKVLPLTEGREPACVAGKPSCCSPSRTVPASPRRPEHPGQAWLGTALGAPFCPATLGGGPQALRSARLGGASVVFWGCQQAQLALT